jgi:hypothetical protein
MAINITSTKEQTSFIKMMVYGDAGVGKTSLIATAPNPIIISSESGLLPLAGHDIPVIKIQSYEDLIEAYNYCISSDYETICIDSLSDIAETILAVYKSEERDPRKAYGKLADDLLMAIRAFRDIEGKHVYMVSKQARLEDSDTGICAYRPAFPGQQLNSNIPYFFDLLLCLRITKDDDGNTVRYLQTEADISHVCKDRSGKLNTIEEPNLENIFNKIKGVQDAKAESEPKKTKASS